MIPLSRERHSVPALPDSHLPLPLTQPYEGILQSPRSHSITPFKKRDARNRAKVYGTLINSRNNVIKYLASLGILKEESYLTFSWHWKWIMTGVLFFLLGMISHRYYSIHVGHAWVKQVNSHGSLNGDTSYETEIFYVPPTNSSPELNGSSSSADRNSTLDSGYESQSNTTFEERRKSSILDPQGTESTFNPQKTADYSADEAEMVDRRREKPAVDSEVPEEEEFNSEVMEYAEQILQNENIAGDEYDERTETEKDSEIQEDSETSQDQSSDHDSIPPANGNSENILSDLYGDVAAHSEDYGDDRWKGGVMAAPKSGFGWKDPGMDSDSGANSDAGDIYDSDSVAAGVGGETILWRGASWQSSIGMWMETCHQLSTAVEVKELLHGRSCPSGCSSSGVCNAEFGQCRCRLGSTGQDCSNPEKQRCRSVPIFNTTEEADVSNSTTTRPNFDDAILPSGRLDFSTIVGRKVSSICVAACDERHGWCFCGENGTFPGRPVASPCGFRKSSLGGILWDEVDTDRLYSTSAASLGWCHLNTTTALLADSDSFKSCQSCRYDGYAGPLCDRTVESFCINQCTGNGVCLHGFCQCFPEWYGADCSIPTDLATTESLPAWIKGRTSGRESLVSGPLFSGPSVAAKKERPLIYVYDLPAEINVLLLEGRQWKEACVHRLYGENNQTLFNGEQRYALEIVLFEALLSSSHRTVNPDEADYFFVPVLGSCMMERINDSAAMDIPPSLHGQRSLYLMHLYSYVQRHIQRSFPFWNRTHGRDHLWALGWDEGGCLAPASIWNSTIISHWGNTMSPHVSSVTAAATDSWSDAASAAERGSHPCFHPGKDIVMPAWLPPNLEQISGKYWARTPRERPTLFYFAGDLGYNYLDGTRSHRFSLGIRQSVAQFFGSTPNMRGRLGSHHSQDVIVLTPLPANHSLQIASSRFCGVFPGNGFSSSMEEAMMSGCIPVIIQDGIQLPFENFLNYSNFTVRIPERKVPELIDILRAIPESEVGRLQEAVSRQWQRWTYHSLVAAEANRKKEMYGQHETWAFANSLLKEDDAMATLMQILHFKLFNDEWRKNRHFGKETGLPKSCF